MSDNIKKIEDNGWKLMSSRLEKEMPLKKKRRNVFFILLMAALFTGVFSTLLFYALSKSSDSSKIDSEFHTANTKNISTDNNDFSEDAKTQITSSNTLDKASSSTNQIVNESIISKNQKRTIEATKPIKSASLATNDIDLHNEKLSTKNTNNDKINNNYILSENTRKDEKSETPILIEKSSNQDGINFNTFSQNTEVNQIRETDFIRLLSAQELKPISIERSKLYTTQDYVTNNSIPSNKLNKFHVNAGLGIKILPKSNNAFYIVGTDIGYFLDKNWKINSGIFYSKSKNSIDTLSIAKEYAEFEVLTKFNNLGASNLTIDKISVSKHSYLHIPFTIEYLISKNLGVKAGAYYEKSISKNTTYDLTNSNMILDQEKANFNNYVDQKIINHNFNWSVGLTLFPRNKFSVSIDVFKNDKFTSGNELNSKTTKPFVQLLARYRLFDF
jgi:hypothetical protein